MSIIAMASGSTAVPAGVPAAATIGTTATGNATRTSFESEGGQGETEARTGSEGASEAAEPTPVDQVPAAITVSDGCIPTGSTGAGTAPSCQEGNSSPKPNTGESPAATPAENTEALASDDSAPSKSMTPSKQTGPVACTTEGSGTAATTEVGGGSRAPPASSAAPASQETSAPPTVTSPCPVSAAAPPPPTVTAASPSGGYSAGEGPGQTTTPTPQPQPHPHSAPPTQPAGGAVASSSVGPTGERGTNSAIASEGTRQQGQGGSVATPAHGNVSALDPGSGGAVAPTPPHPGTSPSVGGPAPSMPRGAPQLPVMDQSSKVMQGQGNGG
ncbi:unnamed protein product, partial [Discosporangium mesarthrocarpum]